MWRFRLLVTFNGIALPNSQLRQFERRLVLGESEDVCVQRQHHLLSKNSYCALGQPIELMDGSFTNSSSGPYTIMERYDLHDKDHLLDYETQPYSIVYYQVAVVCYVYDTVSFLNKNLDFAKNVPELLPYLWSYQRRHKPAESQIHRKHSRQRMEEAGSGQLQVATRALWMLHMRTPVGSSGNGGKAMAGTLEKVHPPLGKVTVALARAAELALEKEDGLRAPRARASRNHPLAKTTTMALWKRPLPIAFGDNRKLSPLKPAKTVHFHIGLEDSGLILRLG